MKAIKAIIGILAVGIGLAFQTQGQSFLTNGLVAYYPFDGNANDASGNTNNLTNHGAVLCADRFGNSNRAYFFNGTNYLGSSTSPLSQVDNWTLTAWIEPGILPQATGYAVCVGYDSYSSGDGFSLGISGSGDPYSTQPSNQLWAFFPGVIFVPTGYKFPSTNQWSQVVMTRGSGALTLYVNGVTVTNGSTSANVPLTPTSFEVGSGGTSRFFTGAVDDVRVYDVALSQSEVQELYNYEANNPSVPCTPYAATATATISAGFVIAAPITDNGCGYSNNPSVLILGGGGTGATATPVVTNGIVESIVITDAGSGYTSVPEVFIAPPGGCVPHAAVATLVVSNGFVIGATITDPGCGYTNAPTLQIIGGGGTGATATTVFTNGEVVGITITDAGIGYTNTPGVYFSSPIAAEISLLQAVEPGFSNLSVGQNYQLQSSTDLLSWTNQGPVFTATNTTMNSSQFFEVLGMSRLYFRLQGAL